MTNGKKISIGLLLTGGILFFLGIYIINFGEGFSDVIGSPDQSGMYVMCLGAVCVIFGTGSLVGEKSK